MKHKDKIIDTLHLCIEARKKLSLARKGRANEQKEATEFIVHVEVLFDLIEEILLENEDKYKSIIEFMNKYREDLNKEEMSYKNAFIIFKTLKRIVYEKRLTDLGMASEDWEADTIEM